MTRRIPRPAVFAITTAVFLPAQFAKFAGFVAAAPPTPIIPNVTGFWSGNFASSGGGTGLVKLSVPTQERHRFAGTFVFTPPTPIAPPQPIRISGTVWHGGKIKMVGRADGLVLSAHGTLIPGTIQLTYHFVLADGTTDTGTAVIAAGPVP